MITHSKMMILCEDVGVTEWILDRLYKHYMLINISSSHVILSLDQHRIITIPRWWLEIELPKTLYQLYQEWVMQGPLFVINGPWSFTNLRVWCLCLNLLQELLNQSIIWPTQTKPISLYTLDKIGLYKYLYDQKILWPVGLLYIGQQKNGWRIDLESWDQSTASLINNDEFDRIDEFDSPLFDRDPRQIKTWFHDGHCTIQWWWKHTPFDPLQAWFSLVSTLIPNYIMQPNIQSKSS